ncbi:MAG: 16S rRNA (cytidine(1402)-2'-O)-methyltransferase [Vicinamibacterales bacterium]
MASSQRPPADPPPSPSRGRLSVVATPIGNLEDITLRALRVLREAGLVLAEDTRRTGNLLRHYEIRTPLASLHAHNEHAKTPDIVAGLLEGRQVALVTDAGMPGISDPGMTLVSAARAAGVAVEVIPGPSAVVTALAACGLADRPFVFMGFAEMRSKDRKIWFRDLASRRNLAVVCFEAPHRLRRFLTELAAIGVDRDIFLCRELTKLHEEVIQGTPAVLLEQLAEPRGEFTIVIPAAGPGEGAMDRTSPPTDAEVGDLFGQTTENTAGSKRDRARIVADRLGMSTRQVYDALERLKSLG